MKITISVTRRTKYTSIVEMEPEKYVALRDAYYDGNSQESRDAADEINELIDASDWQDDSLDRVDDIAALNPEEEIEN